MKDFPKIRGISRMKYARTAPGWFVRYTREGVTFRKHFNDSAYGSPEASLEAAKEWHQQARSLLPPMNRREYANQKKTSNKSGIVGVYRTSSITKGHRYACWVASWSPWKGKKGMKTFAVLKFGEEGAKQMAIAAREEALKSLESQWPEDYWEYRRRLDSQATGTNGNEKPGYPDIFAFEGEESHRTHVMRERDRQLRTEKLTRFLDEHGHLFCEICGFDFEFIYGELGIGMIEIHHTFPVAQMEPQHKTRLQDLLCVCSNCHLVLHNGDPYVNLQKLRFIFDARTTKEKRSIASSESPPVVTPAANAPVAPTSGAH